MTSTRKRSARKVDAETYRVGDWAGHPNFGCPFCPYRTLEGASHVVAHIASDHREQAIAQAQEAH